MHSTSVLHSTRLPHNVLSSQQRTLTRPLTVYIHDVTMRSLGVMGLLLVLFLCKICILVWSLPLVCSNPCISVPQWKLQFYHLVLVGFLFWGPRIIWLASLELTLEFIYFCCDFILCCSQGLTQQAWVAQTPARVAFNA